LSTRERTFLDWWQMYRTRIILPIIGLIFAAGGWVAYVEHSVAGAERANDRQDKILEEVLSLQKEMRGQLSVLLKFLNVQAPDTAIARWKAMPREIPLDTLTGKPIPNVEWLLITHDYQFARTFKWVEGDTIFVRVEWDVREKE